MRSIREYHIEDQAEFKKKLLWWSRQYDEIAWLDSNDFQLKHKSFDAVLAVQAFTLLKTDHHQAFDQLQEYQEITHDWVFGYMSYDLKNDVEDLTSNNPDGLQFPDLYFFQPQKLFLLKGNLLEVHYLKMVDDEMDSDFMEISKVMGHSILPEEEREKKLAEIRNQNPGTSNQKEVIQQRISKPQYLKKINEMLQHIHRGDIYEANFCQEFFAENRVIEPFTVFDNLNKISAPPFAVFMKFDEYYLLSASPERYLKKAGRQVISQPIKGTARRSEDKEEDDMIAKGLSADPKEQSENIMIVDLVRNDLSRTAKKGSVKVEELCKVYSFKQVHQMISTISAELEENIPPVEILRSTFPMGSMTGAPKISAMKIIEELEETKRGLYSGAVGYFTPEGDFDFSVVIRSILFNSKNKYLSFSVGGAITANSIPENEYEECLLKAGAMHQALNSLIR